ncbi:MAG TPA: hypothetical protein VK145_01385 [Candidatus Nanoarchaeia archaeon]|nr:hypothetical protein [Candidatus Nanoarchaeia archaeon]
MSFFISALVLSVAASLLQILGYWIYFVKIREKRVRPNTASWSIWAFGAVLESVSYVFVTGDWVKNLLPVACALCAVLLFLYCVRYGHFEKLSQLDRILVMVDLVIILIWWLSKSPIYANILLVITAVVSFLPIIRSTWINPRNENASPWFFWTSAYCLLTILVMLRWEKWEDLVYPVTFAILHALIGIFALDSRLPKTP